MKKMKNKVTVLLCMVFIATMMYGVIGCGAKPEGTSKETNTEASTPLENPVGGMTILGEGATVFPFTVVDKDGNETVFEIHTDKKVVGEALTDLGLVVGEEGPYGIYVKEVNGITADFDTDGTYWAFYVNDEYAVSGVDVTEIEEGASYSFKVEK